MLLERDSTRIYSIPALEVLLVLRAPALSPLLFFSPGAFDEGGYSVFAVVYLRDAGGAAPSLLFTSYQVPVLSGSRLSALEAVFFVFVLYFEDGGLVVWSVFGVLVW